jgi:flagellar capping protein FliD
MADHLRDPVIMGDILIPGISSGNIDVKGIIDKLVKVEAKKLDRLETNKETLDKEKASWSSLGNKMNGLQETSHRLHGFRAPFDDKVAFSSRDDIFTANAARIAEPRTATVQVNQIAQNERMLSDPVATEVVFESATLRFAIGEDEVEVFFPGGRIEDLAKAINDQAGDYLTAKLTRNTEDTTVLILESKNTGSKNRITVTDEGSFDLLKEVGLFEEHQETQFDTRISSETVSPVEQGMAYRAEDQLLILEPESSAVISIDPIPASDSVVVSVQMRAVDLTLEEARKRPDRWPELQGIGSVTVRDIDIIGGGPVASVAAEEEPPEPKIELVEDTVLGITRDDGEEVIYEAEGLGPQFKEYQFSLSDLLDDGDIAAGLLFRNRNTGRRVEYRDLSIIDTVVREGAAPKHLVQEGKDSIVFIDGVKVQRDTNEIDDAILGVGLELKSASPDSVELTVDRDYEKITGEIVKMIGKYNELLQFINEQTQVVASGELDESNEIGTLSGDITVMGLKSKLQTIMMNPYPTEKGRELNLLAQIGISMGAANSDWNDIRGGYLQVDEDAFVEAFRRYPDEIKQLFGSDNNGDSIPDNGVAYVLDNTLKGYTDPRTGIIDYHIKNTDTRIKDQQKSIDDWNEHIDDYRRKLERDFTLMQQSLNELEQSQKRLDNFSNQYNTK